MMVKLLIYHTGMCIKGPEGSCGLILDWFTTLLECKIGLSTTLLECKIGPSTMLLSYTRKSCVSIVKSMMVILLVYHTGMDNLAQQVYYYAIY